MNFDSSFRLSGHSTVCTESAKNNKTKFPSWFPTKIELDIAKEIMNRFANVFLRVMTRIVVVGLDYKNKRVGFHPR